MQPCHVKAHGARTDLKIIKAKDQIERKKKRDLGCSNVGDPFTILIHVGPCA
jgi:hypothetical protein